MSHVLSYTVNYTTNIVPEQTVASRRIKSKITKSRGG